MRMHGDKSLYIGIGGSDMTIDEAIIELKSENGYYANNGMIDVAEFNTEIIRWLEELKDYRENQHRSLRHMYEKGYNKAIDNFSMEIDKYIERYDGTIYDEEYYTNVKSDFEDLKKIGNQLKAGV